MATSSVGFEDIEKLKVPELRKLCKEHGLTSTGKKEELLNRLKEALLEADDNILEESGEGDLVPESTVADDVNEDILNEEPAPVKLKSTPTPPAVKPPIKHQISTEKENGAPPKKIVKIGAASSPPVSPTTEQISFSKSLTDEQRLALRAQKFGLSSDEARKAARAERFGVSKPTSGTGNTKLSTAGTTVDVEKLKQRAERFGTVTSKTLTSADVDAKLQKRKERFGVVNQDDKIKKRQERFGAVTISPSAASGAKGTNLVLEEAKRKRAERFGLNK